MRTLTTWLMASFFRWFPHRAPTGLRAVGRPNEHSPVLVTGNYTLTLARLLREVKGLDLWLLVANSGGINVWCGACGGIFTDHQVIGAIKTSALADKVQRRTLILPPLSAPGMNRERIREETGFNVRFGPVKAEDVPAFLAGGLRKTPQMKRADFGLKHRLDMLVSMNFIIWLPLALIFALVWPRHFTQMSILFWGIAIFQYVCFPWIPGRNGWQKAMTVAVALDCCYVAAGWITGSDVLAYWPWMLAAPALVLAIGFDSAGIAGAMPSDPEAFMQKLGIKSLGFLFNEKPLGQITLEPEKCSGCLRCEAICPVGVYDLDIPNDAVILARPDDCFSCGACVKQCPDGALTLATPERRHAVA